MAIYIDGKKIQELDGFKPMSWNLLNHSSDFKGWTLPYGNFKAGSTTPYGNSSLQKPGPWNFAYTSFEAKAGKIYTVSFSAMVIDPPSEKCDIRIYENSSYEILRKYAFEDLRKVPTNTWQTGYITIRAKNNSEISAGFSPNGKCTVAVGDYMVNEGTIPAQWNYSLKDFRELFGGVNSPAIPYISAVYVTSRMEVA